MRGTAALTSIVPTGLDVRGRTIYMAEAGPAPHLPENGEVVAFRPSSPAVRDVAAGARLLVDVEFGPRHRLYALSQGFFTPVIDRLNQPTSLEFIGKAAYVVTLGGEIWKINGI